MDGRRVCFAMIMCNVVRCGLYCVQCELVKYRRTQCDMAKAERCPTNGGREGRAVCQ